jgi:hypothetical protein
MSRRQNPKPHSGCHLDYSAFGKNSDKSVRLFHATDVSRKKKHSERQGSSFDEEVIR